MRFRDFMKDRVAMFMAIWGVVNVVSYIVLLLVGQGEEWASDATYFPYDGAIVISVIVLAFVIKFYGIKSFEGKVWLLITIGLGLWMVSEVIHGLDILMVNMGADGIPAAIHDNTDYPFLAGYIFIALGFLYKMRFTKLYEDFGKAYVILVLVGIFTTISAYLVIGPTLATTDYTDSEKFFLIAYVALDILLFGISLTVALYWGAAVSKGWYILAFGLLAMMIADVGYTALDLRGVYFDGALIELAWVAAYLLIGLAGYYQKKMHESFM